MKNNEIYTPGDLHDLLAPLVLRLERGGIALPELALVRMARHLELLRAWNAYASLVSAGDLEHLVDRHLTDSLSLAPFLRTAPYAHLDIGSGGGFPALPLKCLFPDRALILVERSTRKVGFLRKAVTALKLSSVQIIQGTFPQDLPPGIAVGSVTARAVERPEVFVKDLLRWLPTGAVFLCQSDEAACQVPGMFHVEQVQDDWECAGLRRGTLRLVRRAI